MNGLTSNMAPNMAALTDMPHTLEKSAYSVFVDGGFQRGHQGKLFETASQVSHALGDY